MVCPRLPSACYYVSCLPLALPRLYWCAICVACVFPCAHVFGGLRALCVCACLVCVPVCVGAAGHAEGDQ